MVMWLPVRTVSAAGPALVEDMLGLKVGDGARVGVRVRSRSRSGGRGQQCHLRGSGNRCKSGATLLYHRITFVDVVVASLVMSPSDIR